MESEKYSQQDALERARQIHAEHIVVDSLAPTFTCEMLLTPAMADLGRRLQSQGTARSLIRTALAEYLIETAATDPVTRDAYIAYWRRAGVTAASSTLYDAGPPARAWEDTLTELARGSRLLQALNGALGLGDSAAAIEQAHREGRHVVIYNLQNPEPIGEGFDHLDILYNFGVRIVQVAYNLRNRFADGCVERCDGGLSRLGETLVDRLNQQRILIDLSHSSDRTAMDVIAYAAQIACQLGADVVKVKLPSTHLEQEAARKVYEKEKIPIETLPDRVRHVIQSAFNGRRIVIFSGGGKISDEELLGQIRAIRDGGGFGSIIGRNSFQRPREEAVKLLRTIMEIYKGA